MDFHPSANLAHRIQPLDVGIFTPFKDAARFFMRHIEEYHASRDRSKALNNAIQRAMWD